MQTVLITGANGFLGHYLTQRLLRSGHKVVATGKGPCRLPFQSPDLFYHQLDLTEPESVFHLFEATQPQIVVHAGAMTRPDECEGARDAAWQVNVAGTENVLAAAEASAAYVVHISTDFVFGGTKECYTEFDAPDPVNYYGVTKWEAEKRVQAYKGPWAVVRPILIYGYPQRGRENILMLVAAALQEGRELKLFTDQLRLPTYVEDLTWGIEQVMTRKAEGIYHFCGPDAWSPYDIGQCVAEYLDLNKGLIKPVTAATFHQPARRPPRTMFLLDKVKNEFGYKPTTFKDGLHKTFQKWSREL